MTRMTTVLAWSVGFGVLIAVLLGVWAYAAKDDTWEFRGSVASLQSLDAEVRLLPGSTFSGLTPSLISAEAGNIKEEAQKEGDSIHTLSLPESYQKDQAQAIRQAATIASSSEAIEYQ